MCVRALKMETQGVVVIHTNKKDEFSSTVYSNATSRETEMMHRVMENFLSIHTLLLLCMVVLAPLFPHFNTMAGVKKLRLFDPNPDALSALDNSGIDVILGVLHENLQGIANDIAIATQWVNDHVVPHTSTTRFTAISAGNEILPDGADSPYILPAMTNLRSALDAANLQSIPVSTTIHNVVLGASFPPSAGVFSDKAKAFMEPIARFLKGSNAPLLVNAYPYYGYAGDPKAVRLDYAIFTANGTVVTDGSLEYQNMFDAILDAFYSALEKVDASDLDLIVAETGWPSAGNPGIATIDNARTHNNNVVAHVLGGSGTPKRPGKKFETYLFGLFNENQKPEGTERNFGLFYPDMTEVYPMKFTD
ncbi:hypothetical protein QJS04_geneDACA001078 [Acorus gramineus]|uniref:Glucan endo-1,3-beta-D-glucosidase n=1 Tax=Acorus gramineus TaxID=55184 RepID=A0AAV9AE94_ACOGR|nr:hypothetical protein QJS04_geneDACA001078 [Acorus gramineus]